MNYYQGKLMKHFFEKYSYTSVKLFLNQIAIAMFGLVLALSAGMAENDTLQIVVSVLSVVFFLFLQYTVAYKLGTEDRVSIDLGKAKADYLLPVKIWLLGNSINLLLAIFIMLGHLFSGTVFGNIGGVCVSIAVLIEGMYSGLLTLNVGGAPLNSYWWMFFIITLPALVVVFLSYVAGLKSKKIAKIFEFQYPESDRPEKKSKKR